MSGLPRRPATAAEPQATARSAALPIEDFDFTLPESLIARRPAVPRDSARMLEIAAALGDLAVPDLPQLLAPNDVIVFNDTKVIEARLSGTRAPKTGGPAARIEVTLHKETDSATWRAFARPAKRLRQGDRIEFAPGFEAVVAEKCAGGEIVLRFGCGGEALRQALERFGAMPIPPYIARRRAPDERDKRDYQTIFAKTPGAVAAPTAGLHFTPELMARLRARGVETAAVTLHVGAGTFLPVKTENVLDHRMHGETGHISETAARIINEARAKGGRVVAVGSTVLRLLEAAADGLGVRPFAGETDIFITPRFRFRIVDLLLTNFHLPRSTLFILVCAFAGTRRMHAAYAHAIRQKYRFYSYGDCCLIHRGDGR